MRFTVFFFLSLVCFQLSAQSSDKAEIQKTVDAFFKAFHAKDSVALKTIVNPDIILQTIGFNKDGEQVLKSENFNDLVKSITSIPDNVRFQERLLEYSIQVDGAMANAWTPYEFWLNDEFHHCGVNSFQLYKDIDGWKIIYLIDTRRKKGCNQ